MLGHSTLLAVILLLMPAALRAQDHADAHEHSQGAPALLERITLPSLSIAADLALALSNQENSFERANRFVLRSIELGAVGEIESVLDYEVYVHFDENTVELEEAFARAHGWLPEGLQLRAGRFNLDFGQLSPLHDHDLPFLDKPQVVQDYLGGALRGTGAELSRELRLDDQKRVRASLTVVNRLDGDAHAVFGPAAAHTDAASGAEPFGRRGFDNFAYAGRALGTLEPCRTCTIDLGVSAAYAPSDRVFFDVAGNTHSADLKRLLVGGDATWRLRDPDSGEGFSLSGELLWSKRDVRPATGPITDVSSVGSHAYAIRHFDEHWSAGASGGWFQYAEDSGMSSWDTGLFCTWQASPANRLRIEVRHFDDPGGSYWGAAVQWTILLGRHDHAH